MTAEETNVRLPPTSTTIYSSTSTSTETTTKTTILCDKIDHNHHNDHHSMIVPIELTENFYINNRRKNNVKIQVKLNGSGIYLRRETEHKNNNNNGNNSNSNRNNNINEQLLNIEDIIGSRFGSRLKKRVRGGLNSCKRNLQTQENEEDEERENQHKDISAYLYIYAYIKSEKQINATTAHHHRHRTVRILRFRSYDRFEENLKSAERWYRGIRFNKNLACGLIMANSNHQVVEQPKPLLILLNPKSGSGKSRELFQKQVVPVLKEAEVHYELQITTHANHARELIRCRKDLEKLYSGIVVASGDGLFYEVLNGVMERIDWRTICCKVPIGIIPCGSGNGLAKSIAHLYNESYEKPIVSATLTCVSGHRAPMDIVRVELAKFNGGGIAANQSINMYSFLSIGWGFIADIDIESERLRSIGAQRFTLWTIHRLISLRTYKGKLSYVRLEPNNHQPANVTMAAVNTTEQPSTSKNFESVENGFYDAQEEPTTDDLFDDAASFDGTKFRPHVDSWHSATSKATAYYSIAGQSIRSRRSLTGSILSKLEAANAEFESRIPGPPAPTIPPLNMPLPEDQWTVEDGEFIMVHAAYTTHLSTDCYFAPDSRLNDGVIYLIVIRGGCSRSQLFQFMLGLSTGTHIPCTPNEYIEVIPVRAFRIEPNNDVDGIMAVDGERVDYGSIQAEILPGIIKVMVPHGEQ